MRHSVIVLRQNGALFMLVCILYNIKRKASEGRGLK